MTAYVFDFDETLVKDKARSYLYRDGVLVGSLSSEQYYHYKKQPNEFFDFFEFDYPDKIKANFGPVWQTFKRLYELNEPLFIVTARRPTAKQAIYEFVLRNGVNILYDNIYCIGAPSVYAADIPKKKEEVILRFIKPYYDEIIFYEDNDLVIDHFKNKKWLTPILVSELKNN